MVMMYRIGLLLLVAALAVAQDPSDVQNLSPGRRGIVEWPECLEDVKSREEVEDSMEICDKVVRNELKMLLRNYTSNIPTAEMIKEFQVQQAEIYSKCVVQRLGLIAADGSLDLMKLYAEIDQIRAPRPIVMDDMKAMSIACVTASGNDTIAAKQFQKYMMCLIQSATEYCETKGKLLEAYLSRETTTSVCPDVLIPPANMVPVGMECVAEVLADSVNGVQEAEHIQNAFLTMFGQGPKAQGAAAVYETWFYKYKQPYEICVATKMGNYIPETGFDWVAVKSFLANMSDWDPEVLTRVTDAMASCDEGVTCTLCVRPKLIEICGFSNAVTDMFCGFLDAEMARGAVKYAEEVLDVEGIFTYDDDDDDDMDDDENTSDENTSDENTSDEM